MDAEDLMSVRKLIEFPGGSVDNPIVEAMLGLGALALCGALAYFTTKAKSVEINAGTFGASVKSDG
ncbi:hypothetical protein [Variovorax sp. dw_308]|uniref:hypothetical protein n=1 Tax=Variovorax sp. dw_308 TaxID=2721546 RepID=UPI001C47440B|nr:hypothetical protein [Variovorax sp. dw_308]